MTVLASKEVYAEALSGGAPAAGAKALYAEVFFRLPPTTRTQVQEVYLDTLQSYTATAKVQARGVYTEVLRSRRVRRTPLISITEVLVHG